MSQKVVLFDIDYTLFDTECFRKKLYQALSEILRRGNAYTKKLADDVYEETRKETGYFEPTVFIQRLFGRLKTETDKKVLRRTLWNKKNFEECIYEETSDVVEQLAKEAQVGIFSKGYNAFQRAKLSAIKHLLDDQHIHIAVDKQSTLPQILKRYRSMRLYLVDDALDVLHIAKQLNKHVFTIWVKRGRFAKAREPIAGFVPDAEVKDLRTIPTLIRE